MYRTMQPKQLSHLDLDYTVSEIYDMLESINIPKSTGTQGRNKTFGPHKSMTLGYITPRISRKYGLSKLSRKYPELYEAVKLWGETFVPFPFTTIHVNQNVVCPKHTDSQNVGLSCIVSIGDYEGCNLVVEGFGIYDTMLSPIVFDGSKLVHFNEPLLAGTKYSFVFYNSPTK